MSSSKTSNYQLNQWVKSDRVLMSEFNSDNAKIDAALKAHDTSIASKASSSSVSSLTTTVNGLKSSKADKSALETVKTTVDQHTATLAKKGNCQVYVTGYNGGGKYGESSPSSLTFAHRPVAVFLASGRYLLTLIRGVDAAVCDTLGGGEGIATVSWGEKSVTWYADSATTQMTNGCTVVALLDAEN